MTFEMKHIFKSITFGIALLAGTVTAFAQGYDPDHPTTTGVNVLKNVTGPDANNDYTITLETFAEGTTAVTYSSIPSDIILVLDTSSSMRDNNYPAGNGNPTRIAALKTAVREFVATIYDNAMACKELDANYVNRIAIVTYNRNATMVQSWVDITTVVTKNGNTYSGSLMTKIGTDNSNGFTCASGTRPDHGLDMVINELLDGTPNAKRADANLTVLLFTDGYPTDNAATGTGDNNGQSSQQQFEYPFANKTLYYGSQIKNTYGATVYTVGLIESVGQNNTWYRNYRRVLTMMDWLSSNYTGGGWTASITTLPIESSGGTYDGVATYYNGYDNTNGVFRGNNIPAPWNTEWVVTGTGTNRTVSLEGYNPGTAVPADELPEGGYSILVGGDNDLSSIFKSISNASGGSASPADSDTQIRDVVSNSFVLPEGFDEESISVATWDITSTADDWVNETDVSDDVSIQITTVTGADGKVRNELIVEGFDFSADGAKDAHGYYTNPNNEGNWVGKRYTNKDSYHYAGKKLVISFKIKANGEATGGDGTNTNHPDSGVYLMVKDEDGNPIPDEDGNPQYTKLTSYPIPNANLPLIIKITKSGLKRGESATFEIHRYKPLMNADGTYQTNALGKPKPDTSTFEKWSKVILTNKSSTDGAKVEKILYALDPGYVYEIAEDDWAWSYTLSGTGTTLNTSEVEVNPFDFVNTPKEGVVKHAEAVTINHFEGTETDAYEEHYKSVGKAQ